MCTTSNQSSEISDEQQQELEAQAKKLASTNSMLIQDLGKASFPFPSIEQFYLRFRENGKALSACTFYSFCSVSMVLVNKSLTSSYNHLIEGDGETDLNILLVVAQAIVAVVCVDSCKRLGLVEYPEFEWKTAKRWAPVNVFFCLMLFTSMAALQYNSVPMVTIFKNIANISTCLGDYYFFGNRPEFLVVIAFFIMLAGAVAAAWNNIEVTGLGLFWMALNCLSTSGYVLYMKFATQTVKLSKFGMVFYNNILCILFLFPAAFLRNEVVVFLQSVALHTPDYFFKNFFAGLIGFLLNFASLQCVALTGPTTYAIIGSVNKIPAAFLGYWLFDATISSQTWFFIAVSMAGGFLYSYAKLRSGQNKAKLSPKVSSRS